MPMVISWAITPMMMLEDLIIRMRQFDHQSASQRSLCLQRTSSILSSPRDCMASLSGQFRDSHDPRQGRYSRNLDNLIHATECQTPRPFCPPRSNSCRITRCCSSGRSFGPGEVLIEAARETPDKGCCICQVAHVFFVASDVIDAPEDTTV